MDPNKVITLSIANKDIELILHALSQRPYIEVAQIIQDIIEQGNNANNVNKSND